VATILAVLLLCLGCSRTREVAVPGCTRVVARASLLDGARSTSAPLPGQPFGIAVDRDYAFVTIGGFSALPQLGVLEIGHGLRIVRLIKLPVEGAAGLTLTSDHRRLLVAAGSGLTEVDVRAAETGRGRAVVASLGSGGDPGSPQWSAIEVAVAGDGRYAFVSLEYAGRIEVFDLRRRRLVGSIPVRAVDVGLALSPDGRTLYATSGAGSYPVTPGSAGRLTVIDVGRAERDAAHAVIRSVPAGCDPVRVVAAADGGDVWVSARGSNAVLEYSAAALRKTSGSALEAVVRVGAAPVGLRLFEQGRRLLVLDSDRFGSAGARSSLTVVDTSRRKATGRVPSGAFAREAALDGRGGVLVTDFDAGEVQSVHFHR
jgi:DNA-binding beta-propeller fold protein YncE